MSKRRILNASSRKKQDNMLNFVTNDSSTGTVAPFIVAANVGATFLWRATGRDRVTNPSDATANSSRETDVVYMRGLREKIFLATNDAEAWRWRRVCFTAKGTQLFPLPTALKSANGWLRQLRNFNGTTNGSAVTSIIFRGAQNVDWFDVFTAKLDTNVITVKYDRTRVLASGNNTGKMFQSTLWHPMNQNLVYFNDENGPTEDAATFSAPGKAGMGDYYVVDFFDCRFNTSTTTTLTFSPEATLYWHEK